MSAEVLRGTAARIRGDVAANCWFDHEPFVIGVADWLDREADFLDSIRAKGIKGHTTSYRDALAVARAYLGA